MVLGGKQITTPFSASKHKTFGSKWDKCPFNKKQFNYSPLACSCAWLAWTKVLECCDSCHCLYLDFAKVFNSVPHHRLLLKLQALDISGQLLNWINCFLTTQSQRVVINGQYSEWLPIASGVPQGSILGPLLFILYVNDARHVVKHSFINVFANDISFYSQVSCYDDCIQLQIDLSCVYQWSLQWQLKLNPRLLTIVISVSQLI